MSTAEKIVSEIEHLGPEEQSEVLDFVEFLKNRKAHKEEDELKAFSLKEAMRHKSQHTVVKDFKWTWNAIRLTGFRYR